MDFRHDPGDTAFRHEVRAFLAAHLPADLARRTLRRFSVEVADTLHWQRILFANGWGAPGWPVDEGGLGWSARRLMIFEEECHEAGAPMQNFQGFGLLAPVLMAFGTQAQKQRYLPAMLRGDAYWCQGFSEPGAGSDLAALRTRAVRDGDAYVIDGSKIWTSYAHQASDVFLLVRTGDPGGRRDGLSMICAPMSAPGISVRPIVSIDGQHHLNETFYDGVRVRAENLIGGEGNGWKIAKFLLDNERGRTGGTVGLHVLKGALRRARRLAAVLPHPQAPMLGDRAFAARLEVLEAEAAGIEMMALRLAADDPAMPVYGPSALKVRATELHQRATALLMEVAGRRGAIRFTPEPDGVEDAEEYEMLAGIAADHLYHRAASIYGGTSEIQRSIVARAILSRQS